MHSHRNNEHSSNLANDGVVYASIYGHIDWEMFECQGCDMVLLRQKLYFSEWRDPYENNDPHKYTYYPLRNTGGRAKPHWYDSLLSAQELKGHFILTAYQQIYLLIESEHYLSAMLACRALLETVAIKNGDGDHRTFEEKLKALEKNGFIRQKQFEYLNNTIFDAGSTAMHRGYNPSREAVNLVLDAIEALLHTIYIEPQNASTLPNEKPKRQ